MISTDSIPTERFSYHSLHLSTGLPLLETTQQLVLDHSTGYSMVIDWQQQMIRNATTFTEEELAVVFTLASNWPSYVPYETLMINEAGEGPTPSQIDDARAARYLETLIAPLKALIETCRAKLHTLGLDISEIDQYGYRLARLNEREEGRH
ncbi:MAG TPA: hypothetical protein VEL31_17960 [Ktedonobacteraceae bacterium]|nr:hypothetical protein [Ktedonobacteraceae bacterium]